MRFTVPTRFFVKHPLSWFYASGFAAAMLLTGCGGGGGGDAGQPAADTLAPTVTVTADRRVVQGGGTVVATFTCSEKIKDFTTPDVTVGNGTVVGTLVDVTPADGEFSVFRLTITAAAAEGALTLNLAKGAFTDLAGNALATDLTFQVMIDNTAPTATVTPTVTTAKTGDVVAVNIVFSEEVQGFDLTDMQVVGGSLSDLQRVDATHYTVKATVTVDDAIMTVAVPASACTDVAGNALAVAAVASVTAATPPTLAVTTPLSATVKGGETLTVDFLFSEAVQGFTASDVTVVNGSTGILTTVSSRHYTMPITAGGSSGPMTASVTAGTCTDLANNALTGNPTVSVTVDATAPTLTLTPSVSVIGAGGSFTLTCVAMEAVSGFDAGDVQVTNGTTGAWAALPDGRTFTLVITATGSPVTASVATGAFSDLVGNASVVATSAPVTVDTVAPTMSISGPAAATIQDVTQWDPATFHNMTVHAVPAGSSLELVLVASEPLLGFTSGMVQVTGGSVDSLAVDADNVTWRLRIRRDTTGRMTMAVTNAAHACTDLAGNSLTVSLSRTIIVTGAVPWAVDQAVGLDANGAYADLRVTGNDYTATQRFRWIEAGRFYMGSPVTEVGHAEAQFGVKLSQGYWLAETECTQELWLAVMGNNPSSYLGSLQCPVEQTSWDDIMNGNACFVKKIMDMSPDLPQVSLPTNAQWEYACRAGTVGPFNIPGPWTTDVIFTVHENTDPYIKTGTLQTDFHSIPVKSLPNRNAWGLYDMHGNVAEFTSDIYMFADAEYFTFNPQDGEGYVHDPVVTLDMSPENFHVTRGGFVRSRGLNCRSESQQRNQSDDMKEYRTGFRIAIKGLPQGAPVNVSPLRVSN